MAKIGIGGFRQFLLSLPATVERKKATTQRAQESRRADKARAQDQKNRKSQSEDYLQRIFSMRVPAKTRATAMRASR